MAGPGRFFVDHPTAYLLSVGGALAGFSYGWRVAERSSGCRRVAYGLLGVQCLVEAIGIILVTEAARWDPERR